VWTLALTAGGLAHRVEGLLRAVENTYSFAAATTVTDPLGRTHAATLGVDPAGRLFTDVGVDGGRAVVTTFAVDAGTGELTTIATLRDAATGAVVLAVRRVFERLKA